jgi:putative nucleotidyltransferase with HDIG domain
MNKEVEAISKKVTNLPTLPTVYTSLCKVMDNPHSTTQDVVQVISGDKSTVSRVLRVVNSAAYGLNQKVETVSQAVVLIGIQEVRNLILGSSIMKSFPVDEELTGFNPENFWKHSIGVGLATRLLGKQIGFADVESLYVAGLLHDIGKLFFISYMPNEYSEVFNSLRENRETIVSAEKRILGVGHDEAGAMVIEYWKLSDYLKQVVRFHHSLNAGSAVKNLVTIVHIADYWVRALDLGSPGDPRVKHPDQRAWKTLTIHPETFSSLTPMLLREHKHICNQMMRPAAQTAEQSPTDD